MNEQIAKLYNQAIVIEDGGDYVCGELDPAKFAELIVQECLYLCESTAAGQDAEAIQEAIKQHFGVER